MRVLVTGGYGCIGCWIAANLLKRGDQVFIYELKEDLRRLRLILSEEQVGRTTFLQGDVTSLASLQAAIEKYQITHIVHLAGLMTPVCRADPILGAKVNVLGTLAVFEAVRNRRGRCSASSTPVPRPCSGRRTITRLDRWPTM